MVSQNPPEPKALSDEELNARVMQLQAQPDGLVAAMALIEEQTRLREEDSIALSSWQTQRDLENATARTEPASATADFFAALEQSPLEPQPEAVAHSAEPEPQQSQVPNPVSPGPTATPPTTGMGQENVSEIVAALNASYAEIAAEGETETQFQVSYEESVSFVADSSETVQPQPLATLLNPEHEVADENDPQPQPEAASKTKSPVALSFSWLALSTSPLILLVVAWAKGAGVSAAQSLILIPALLLFVSVVAASLAAASKRAENSISILSRAAFGVWGNSIPALIMLFVKLLWLGALVYLATRLLSPLLFSQPWFASLAASFIFPVEFTANAAIAIVVVLIAALISGLGGVTLLRAQQLAAVVSVLAIVALAVVVLMNYSLAQLELGDPIAGTELLDLGITLMALFGFAVISQSGDISRKLPDSYPSSKVFFVSLVNLFFPALMVALLGTIWFALDSELADLFGQDMLASLAAGVPLWAFVLIAVAVGISLLQLASSLSYSLIASGYSLGIRFGGLWVAALMALIVLAAVLVVSYLVPVSWTNRLLVEAILLAAVAVAGYLGVLMADAGIRKRGYHEVSLTREYGFYGKFNVINLIGFFLALIVGYGYLVHDGILSSFTGYLMAQTPALSQYTGSLIGIAMAFFLSLLFPVLFGIPKVRKQELNLMELDTRRQELKQFLDTV